MRERERERERERDGGKESGSKRIRRERWVSRKGGYRWMARRDLE